MTPEELAAIKRRDSMAQWAVAMIVVAAMQDLKSDPPELRDLAVAAFHDRRALLAEVERLTAALVAAEDESRRIAKHALASKADVWDEGRSSAWGIGWDTRRNPYREAEKSHSLVVTADTNAAGTLHTCSGPCGWGWRCPTEDEARQKWSDAHTRKETS